MSSKSDWWTGVAEELREHTKILLRMEKLWADYIKIQTDFYEQYRKERKPE